MLAALQELLASGQIRSAFYLGTCRWPVLRMLKAHLGESYSCSLSTWIWMEWEEDHSFDDDPDYAGVSVGGGVAYEGIEPADLLIIDNHETGKFLDSIIDRMNAKHPLKAVLAYGPASAQPSNSCLQWVRSDGVLTGRAFPGSKTDPASSGSGPDIGY